MTDNLNEATEIISLLVLSAATAIFSRSKSRDELPYHAIFATRMRQPNDDELKWAQARARELGLP